MASPKSSEVREGSPTSCCLESIEFGIKDIVIDMAADPMDAIAPSERASEFHRDNDTQSLGDGNDQIALQQNPGPSGVPITMTSKGVMIFLSRKERPRPLLRLICSACGLSTHDPDPIVDGLCLE